MNSDIRYVTNLSNIPDGDVSKLTSLKPKQYQNKDDPRAKLQYGLIAQEVELVYPNIVETAPNGVKNIRYNDLIPLLIANIKSLEEKIDSLKN